MKKLLYVFALGLFFNSANAQTADDVINKYFESTGGVDAWKKLTSIKMTGKANQGGMEFPFTSLQKAPNKQKQFIDFQGKTIVVSCFDGKQQWAMNFMNMKPEKAESEDSDNAQKELDFPDAFLDYKAKGYTATLEGEEKLEGADCYKIKLTKKPMMVEGKETENSNYYFFDKDNGAMIMQRMVAKKGPQKGVAIDVFMSDYQEVNGVFMPFSIDQKMNGQTAFSIKVEKAEANAEVADSEFTFPEN